MLKFLQVNQTGDTVDQLTQSALELAEATANFGALKVMAGVFMAFMILLVVFFLYQLFAMSKQVSNINEAAQSCNNFFKGVADRTLGIDQSRILIRRSFTTLTDILQYAILRIRLENHIENTSATQAKVERVVKHEFAEMKTFLSTYICNGVPLGHVLKEEDVKLVIDFLIEQIYIPKDQFRISDMDQSMGIFLNGIKLDYLNHVGIERTA